MAIELHGVIKSFGNKTAVNISNLTLPDKGIFGVFGASGSGKTTFLRLLCGLERPDSGSITGLADKKISYVFQEDRLLPGRTAVQNVAEVSDMQAAQVWLERVGLAGDANKYPAQMSGGMRRRVALARAFAYGGDIYLLDEPLKGLDGGLKESIIGFIQELAKSSLVVLVTHDSKEELLAESSIYLSEK